ncbi:MAG: AbrB/MazE/SpoVT family DNA-binding domain-containing protein [Actinomycetia bacterium]|nr:AbrB/MazE/SpoVT family DNA-binding domain-containing protein [Actinomycetes bacterium]
MPAAVRQQLKLEPGDLVFLQVDATGFRVIRGANPFDALAEAAIEEAARGETIPLEEWARQHVERADE